MVARAFTAEFSTTDNASSSLRVNEGVSALNRLLFYSTLVVMAFVAIPYGTVEPWWIAVYECAVFGIGAFAIVIDFKEKPNARQLELAAPALAIAGLVLLQSFTVSANRFETRLLFFEVLALLVYSVLVFKLTSTHKRLRTVINCVIVIAVVSAVFGIARQTLQQQEIGFGLPLLRKDTGFGQFVNKNHFALLVEMALGLASGLILGGGIKRQFILFYGAAIALMWTALIMTSSRGGLFSMLAQLAFVIAVSLWMRRRTAIRSLGRYVIPSVLLAVTVVGVVAIYVGGDLMVTRLESLSGEIRSEALEPRAGVRRREVWSATVELFKAHPVLGSGFGAYPVAITSFHDASGKWTPEAAHNDYLELVASGGIASLALVGWLAFAVFKGARREILSRDQFRRAACLGALTGIFGVVAHSFVDFGLHVTANAVVFVTLLVITTRKFQGETQVGIYNPE
jgi:O-antigen ligase